MIIDLRSKQANLSTRLAQARVLKQYNVKNIKQTIYIKNNNARRERGNNKSILLTKKIMLQIVQIFHSI